MKNKEFIVDDSFIIFVDKDNEETCYGVKKDYYEKHFEIFHAERNDLEIPENATIEAYRIKKVGQRDEFTDIYNVVDEEPISFPLSNVKFVWIRLVSKK